MGHRISLPKSSKQGEFAFLLKSVKFSYKTKMTRLHEIVIGTTFLMSFFSALVFLNWRLLSRLMEVPGTDLNLEFNFTCSRKKN